VARAEDGNAGASGDASDSDTSDNRAAQDDTSDSHNNDSAAKDNDELSGAGAAPTAQTGTKTKPRLRVLGPSWRRAGVQTPRVVLRTNGATQNATAPGGAGTATPDQFVVTTGPQGSAWSAPKLPSITDVVSQWTERLSQALTGTIAPATGHTLPSVALGNAAQAATPLGADTTSATVARQRLSAVTDLRRTADEVPGLVTSAIVGTDGPLVDTALNAAADTLRDQGFDATTALRTQTTTAPTTQDTGNAQAPVTLGPVARIVSGLLAAIGITPGSAATPSRPMAPQTLLGVLGLIRREIEHTFFNKAPNFPTDTISLTTHQGEPRVITGLPAIDGDGDRITYTAPAQGTLGGPQHGTVTVVANQVTYTPDAGYEGNDTFTLTASDADTAFHLHGLASLFNPLGAHTDTTQVTVTIEDAQNTAPQISDITRNGPDARGVISGFFVVTDRDGDNLVVGIAGDHDPLYGDVEFDVAPAGQHAVLVTYTYTPRQSEQVKAGLTQDVDELDGFTFTITDTEGATVTHDVGEIDIAQHFALSPRLAVSGTNTTVVTSPDGRRVYLADGQAGTVTIIDTVSGESEIIQAGAGAYQMAVIPDGRVYVANLSQTSSVTVINADNTTTQVTGLDGYLTDVAASDDGSSVYVSTINGTVYVIRTDTNALVDTDTSTPGIDPITVASDLAIALDAKDERLYVVTVTGQQEATLHVIDTATNAPAAGTTPMPVGDGNIGSEVLVSPDGRTVYVNNPSAGTVTVVQTADWSITTTPSSEFTNGVALSPAGDVLYVAGIYDYENGDPSDVLNQGKLVVIDAATGQILDSIDLPGTPVADIAVSPDGTQLYVLTSQAGTAQTTLRVIELVGGENTPPTVSATVDTDSIDPADGSVTITVETSDADGDALTVGTTPPDFSGSVSIVDNGDGNYTLTYIPDPQERIRASNASGPITDRFEFIVSDGKRFGVVRIKVPIEPIAEDESLGVLAARTLLANDIDA
jgi:DNA-binding beta-propeller fold protein YncE